MSEMAPGTTGYFQQYLKELQDKFKLKKFIFCFLKSALFTHLQVKHNRVNTALNNILTSTILETSSCFSALVYYFFFDLSL